MVFALVLSLALAGDTIAERFPAPEGTLRVDVAAGSFGAFLRALPLQSAGTPVVAFDGRTIDAPWAKAVVDVDVGAKDLQQCADSAIRLYAEHRRQKNDVDALSFHATSGDPLPWKRFAAGERPSAVKNKIQWSKKTTPSTSPATFRAWLDTVFLWAGSRSLALDTVAVTGDLAPGDLLVVGGSPGHVLVILDVAAGRDGPQLLIGQGYMPAQSFHVIGWFGVDDDGGVTVPSWPASFPREGRRRFTPGL
jgi:hypothetical protein